MPAEQNFSSWKLRLYLVKGENGVQNLVPRTGGRGPEGQPGHSTTTTPRLSHCWRPTEADTVSTHRAIQAVNGDSSQKARLIMGYSQHLTVSCPHSRGSEGDGRCQPWPKRRGQHVSRQDLRVARGGSLTAGPFPRALQPASQAPQLPL